MPRMRPRMHAAKAVDMESSRRREGEVMGSSEHSLVGRVGSCQW